MHAVLASLLSEVRPKQESVELVPKMLLERYDEMMSRYFGRQPDVYTDDECSGGRLLPVHVVSREFLPTYLGATTINRVSQTKAIIGFATEHYRLDVEETTYPLRRVAVAILDDQGILTGMQYTPGNHYFRTDDDIRKHPLYNHEFSQPMLKTGVWDTLHFHHPDNPIVGTQAYPTSLDATRRTVWEKIRSDGGSWTDSAQVLTELIALLARHASRSLTPK